MDSRRDKQDKTSLTGTFKSARAASQFVRLRNADRKTITIIIDGQEASALAGDTLLTALLVNGRSVRESEFCDGPRSGFCLMRSCQDCWVWTPGGDRLQACSTDAYDGLAILTTNPVLK